MKKVNVFVITIIVISTLLLSACANVNAHGSEITVVASTTLVGDVVSQVGGDRIALTVLLPTGADPHTYEPRPQDAASISDAQIIFLNGLELEHSLESLIESNASGTIIEVSDGVEVLPFSEAHEGETGDEAEGHEHAAGDPHTWMDPNLVMIWVNNITEALSSSDPSNASYYQENAASYISELRDLDEWINTTVAVIPIDNRKIVTDHESFGYFANRYHFEVVGLVVSSLSTSSSPSAQELADLENTIQQLNIPAIFVDSTVNPALTEQIAHDTGVKLIEIHNGSLGENGSGYETYLLFMRKNVQAIVDGLK